ncbi:hypothetical protein P1X14_04170 [Sphingomonas sp. AOB5]|uniref:hypothetical protein n=1 Tax=Sphingomonas sp. AOB5 TaxID=3034017 RepID=UPI0023F9B55D|nr:hypothetical protein [Sphingomonas sp. AOB5]MDF7774433.1 hypothetical protein [Sphingomonas sp. AOB5]
MRPNSIVQFERLFLVSFVINVLIYVLTWHSSVAALTARGGMPGMDAGTVLAVFVGVNLLAQLGLYYLVARRASVIAKWILSVWFVVAATSLAYQAFQLGLRVSLVSALGWIGFLIFAWSISYLFKPDAEAWLGKR